MNKVAGFLLQAEKLEINKLPKYDTIENQAKELKNANIVVVLLMDNDQNIKSGRPAFIIGRKNFDYGSLNEKISYKTPSGRAVYVIQNKVNVVNGSIENYINNIGLSEKRFFFKFKH